MLKKDRCRKTILNVLHYAYRPLTTRQIHQFSGISYNTTKKYLTKLKDEGLVQNRIGTNRIFWYV